MAGTDGAAKGQGVCCCRCPRHSLTPSRILNKLSYNVIYASKASSGCFEVDIGRKRK